MIVGEGCILLASSKKGLYYPIYTDKIYKIGEKLEAINMAEMQRREHKSENKKEGGIKMKETFIYLDNNFTEFELKKPICNLRDSEPFIVIKKESAYTPYSIAEHIDEVLCSSTGYYQTIEELIDVYYSKLDRENDLLCIKQKIDMFDDEIMLTHLKNSINAYIDRRIFLKEEE